MPLTLLQPPCTRKRLHKDLSSSASGRPEISLNPPAGWIRKGVGKKCTELLKPAYSEGSTSALMNSISDEDLQQQQQAVALP